MENPKPQINPVLDVLRVYDDHKKSAHAVEIRVGDLDPKPWCVYVDGRLIRTFTTTEREEAKAYGEGLADALEACRISMFVRRP